MRKLKELIKLTKENRDMIVPNGTMAQDTETGELLIYNEGWKPVEGKINMQNGIEMSLYDMNKQLIIQLPNLEHSVAYQQKKILFENFLEQTQNKYYMLYGKEISYFTLFVRDVYSEESMEDVVLECIENIGPIKSIEYTETKDAIEIWVMNNIDEVTCLYLFPYDQGVVNFK